LRKAVLTPEELFGSVAKMTDSAANAARLLLPMEKALRKVVAFFLNMATEYCNISFVAFGDDLSWTLTDAKSAVTNSRSY
jgi:hypothetical protein